MDELITPKVALRDLLSMSDLTCKLLDPEKEYYALLKLFHNNNYYTGNVPCPTLKTLGDILVIPQHVLSRWILTIYNELIGDEDSPPVIKFLTVVEFLVRNYDRFISFEVSGLDYLPRVGEAIQSTYFREYLGGSYMYHVEKIDHNFHKGEHRITVYIKEGFCNKYWHFRKDEAKAKYEIPIMDFIGKSDEQLKTDLRISPYYV